MVTWAAMYYIIITNLLNRKLYLVFYRGMPYVVPKVQYIAAQTEYYLFSMALGFREAPSEISYLVGSYRDHYERNIRNTYELSNPIAVYDMLDSFLHEALISKKYNSTVTRLGDIFQIESGLPKSATFRWFLIITYYRINPIILDSLLNDYYNVISHEKK